MGYNEILKELQKRLTAEKLRKEIQGVYEMSRSQEKRNSFNEKMVSKTWQYQKEYGFEISPRKGHEFWNNEADAFKHAFGSAQMASDLGQWGSLIGGIDHERRVNNNPLGEWNMDSWNNHQGREIYREIQKEYGSSFEKLTQQERDNIIAVKVMNRMKKGQLITSPNDNRVYAGKIERWFAKNLTDKNGRSTGFAAPIVQPQNQYQKIFTPEEIGKMTKEEFAQNESIIMEQVRKGLITNQPPKFDYGSYKNPESGKDRIFTREDIGKMSGDEYTRYEKEITAQLNSIGIPYEKDLPSNIKTYEKEKSQRINSTNPQDGRWVTINGNHIFIEKD